jgi:tRNA(fMet)-specific endonuclease VapC
LGYLLDTNIAIEIGNVQETVVRHFTRHSTATFLSALCLAELQRGIINNKTIAEGRRERLDILLQIVPVLPFDRSAAEAYGRIIAQCGWVKGRDFDRMIAAHAISTSSVLVTANEADFRDIPGLKIENWTRD